MTVYICVHAQTMVRWSSGVFFVEFEKGRARHPHAHAHLKNTHTHCNCPCYSAVLHRIVWLWSRINGGREIRVNLLGAVAQALYLNLILVLWRGMEMNWGKTGETKSF